MGAFPGIFRALLISLLVHGFLLWPRPLTESVRSGTLQARLRTPFAGVAEKHIAVPSAAVAPSPSPVPTKPPPAETPRSAVQAPPQDILTPTLSRSQAGMDAGGLRTYRAALALAARRSGVFVQGLSAGMRGRVELALLLSAQGQVLEVEVLNSSGNTALDQLAVRALGDAAQRTALPYVLQGQAFKLELQMEVD